MKRTRTLLIALTFGASTLTLLANDPDTVVQTETAAKSTLKKHHGKHGGAKLTPAPTDTPPPKPTDTPPPRPTGTPPPRPTGTPPPLPTATPASSPLTGTPPPRPSPTAFPSPSATP